MGDRQNKDAGAGKGRGSRGSKRVQSPAPKARGRQEKVPSPARGRGRGEGRGVRNGRAAAAMANSTDVPSGAARVSRANRQPAPAMAPSGAAGPPDGAASPPDSTDVPSGAGRVSRANRQPAPAMAPSGAASPPDGAASPLAGAASSQACRPRQNGGATPAPPLGCQPRFLDKVMNNVRLKAEEISRAAELVNPLIDTLIRDLRDHRMFSGIERLATGSYYEKVKISKPNEFDIMLKMPIERITLEQADKGGAFYYVSFKRNPKENPLNSCLDENKKLSRMILEKLRSHIKNHVKGNQEMKVSVERKKPGSPAITLLIKTSDADISLDIVLALEVKQSWPPNTETGLNINEWLGSKVRKNFRFQPFYLVAKCPKDIKVMKGDTWRISFSHIEKDILYNHGQAKTCCEKDGQKCCRKPCLKLLKHLLESLKKKYKRRKELDAFCSYHVKTLLFHACVKRPRDEEWNFADLEVHFQMLLDEFVRSLQEASLPHFFIPSFNLFSPELVDVTSLTFLKDKIAFESENKFPVFGEL